MNRSISHRDTAIHCSPKFNHQLPIRNSQNIFPPAVDSGHARGVMTLWLPNIALIVTVVSQGLVFSAGPELVVRPFDRLMAQSKRSASKGRLTTLSFVEGPKDILRVKALIAYMEPAFLPIKDGGIDSRITVYGSRITSYESRVLTYLLRNFDRRRRISR